MTTKEKVEAQMIAEQIIWEENSERIKANFMAELTDLLNRYNAQLLADDHCSGFGYGESSVRMGVYIPAKYDGDVMIHNNIDFDCGNYLPN
jgi:hypothetical protein